MTRQLRNLVFILAILFLSCSSGQDCPEKINLLPMFGGVKKCDEQLQIDKDFLAECDSFFRSKEEAIQYHIDEGWKYFYKNDFDLAMKRFNQAWLLDSTNADVYWGFGNILGRQQNFEESLIYFDKSIKLNPNNSNVWLGAGTSYGQLFFQSKDVSLLNKAIENLKKSVALDSKNALAYGQLTACYTYLLQKDSAKKYLEITDKLDRTAINPEVRALLSN